ncbi:hypothetical protein SAMN05444422_102151 [Halobiforma haloterrestris]|uniref:DUF7573 domain-containing protein n=1 Tax=Natronobacterium haloterrestre TaxID=148448 RepID=A0A1I1E8F9_NATHA|nr:hypothetical protein [Halobiforma haloterrestris]SFB81270.1 hypothetical protein SAMN05444422_102151 [Halobiforma haloterrestris]
MTDASDDATLSEFADAGTSEDADESASGSGAASRDSLESDSESSDPDTTALSTYAWGDYECDRCEEGTVRVWRDDGRLVCPDCKEW